MKDKIFGVLQRVGRSFMLPIALLPVAGLLLGIGSSFTNETMLAAYGLNSVIHPGTLIYTILDVMSQTGSAVFNNLALLFAMGVAIGMARKEKEVAALSGAVAYIIMNTAIQAMINAAGGVEAMPANSTTTMLGITTLQMGVFGGIVVGLGVAALHNRFYKIELPQVLAFFGGTRFVPIISSIVYLVVGIAHVLHLAGGAERHCCAGRTGAGFRLRRHLYLRPAGARTDPLRPAPCVLYAVLADRCGRHRHHRRCDRDRCPEHLLCRAGLQVHHGVLGQRYPLHGR